MIIERYSALAPGTKKVLVKYIKCECENCEKIFIKKQSEINSYKKIGKALPIKFCSKDCRFEFARNKICKVEGCNRQHRALGLCKKHYNMQRRYGRIKKLDLYICRGCGEEKIPYKNKINIKELNFYCGPCYTGALRKEIFKKLGNSCVCCKEKEYLFLDIDHIKGGGNQERIKFRNKNKYFTKILTTKDIKKKYRILCKNCNWGIYNSEKNICPHLEINEK